MPSPVAARLNRLPIVRTHRIATVIVGIGTFFDLFDIFLAGVLGTVLTREFHLSPVQLQSVLASGFLGMFVGAAGLGAFADRFGRRTAFLVNLALYSLFTLVGAFAPSAEVLIVSRFIAGIGIGGEIPLCDAYLSELLPARHRGRYTAIAYTLGFCGVPTVGLLARILVPAAPFGVAGWRWVFAVGSLGGAIIWFLRRQLPESPRWLVRQGRYEEARKSLAWALQVDPQTLPMPTAKTLGEPMKTNWFDLFKYPRSLLVSWLGNAGAQTGAYGITLWAPTLFVLILKVSPQEASKMFILLTVSGFIGRLSFSFLSEKIGRRNCGGLLGFGGAALIILAGYNYNTMVFGVSAFWLILAAAMFFVDGGFAIVGPYAAEVFTRSLRGLLRTYADVGPDRPWRLAERVTCPTLLVYGRKDPLVDSRSAYRATQHFPDAHVVVLPDCGHVAQMEHPEFVAAAWERFCR